MKLRIALIGLSLATSGFAMDEYPPIEKGKIEVDLGYQYVGITGFFDDEGEKQDFTGDFSPGVNAFKIQLKYGLMPGLDLEAVLPYVASNEDAEAILYPSGMAQPEIGVKYALAQVTPGAAVFGNLTLPFGTGDFSEDGMAPLMIELGGVYQNRWGDFRLTGKASYEVSLESDDFNAGDVLDILLKPEAMWTEYVGTYLAVQYQMYGEDEFDGNGFDNAGYLLTVGPGVNAQLTPELSYEVNASYTLAGKNQDAFWAIQAQVYYLLP